MLRILFFFLVLSISIVLGPMLIRYHGYVVIHTDTYHIETSITFLGTILLLVVVLLMVVQWILYHLCSTDLRGRGWFISRKRSRAHAQTKAALIKLAEGDYQQVERLLTRNAIYAEQPMVNYLLAAEAAQQRGDNFQANQYLKCAAEVANTNKLPVDIAMVRIQLAKEEYHTARHGIDRLLHQAPYHPEVLRLAEKTYLGAGAYNALQKILPSMHKIKLYNQNKLRELKQQTYIGMMYQERITEGSGGLKRWWKNQNRKTRHEVPLQIAMVKYLIECNDHEMAYEIILDSLTRHYDERLVQLIPQLTCDNLKQLEAALYKRANQYGATPLLNSVLGQLLMKRGAWQQAIYAFQKALTQRPDGYNYAWLGDALEKLNRSDEAAQMRRKGLILTLEQQNSA